MKDWFLVPSFGLLILITLDCASPFASSSPLPPYPTTVVVRLTADQVAQAMEQDNFFGTYGDDRLVIQGTVATLAERNGTTVIRLATSHPTKVDCAVNGPASGVQVGEMVTVASDRPRADASREAGGVLIENCNVVR